MFTTYIVVACILSVISGVAFVAYCASYIRWDDEYSPLSKREIAVRNAAAGISLIASWFWPITLPLLFIAILTFMIRKWVSDD